MEFIQIINFAKPISGSFIVDIIIWLVGLTSVTAGIILFTVLLKVVTLPFDFMSKASMRKNSLKMEEMRPELEKLQKQYADNKQLYNQKMMALYKKNGYSMFGACLPTILTLVIFIVALNGFSSYSQFQNRQYFYEMTSAYNNAVYYSLDDDENYVVRNEDGSLFIDVDKMGKDTNGFTENHGIIEIKNSAESYVEINKENLNNLEEKIYVFYDSTQGGTNFYLETTFGVVQYAANVVKNLEDKYVATTAGYQAIASKLELASNVENYPLACAENGFFKIGEKTFNVADENANAGAFIEEIRAVKSADTFRESNASFLWVKNIWVSDSPMKHPIETNWETFKKTHAVPEGDINVTETDYANMISKLEVEKNAPNGYFILVVLTAGISLLLQIVTTKSQKAQMELQTVDGQGASTQKMMTWIMPIMMAIFAFMYTAAFSIYIILSSIISIVTTFGINAIIDAKYKKKPNDQEPIRGRVYVPKEEEIEKPKKEKKSKKEEIPKNSFLSGAADNKHVRGRTK